MRINKYLAQATGLSRRSADAVIAENRVRINNQPAFAGSQVETNDTVMLDGRIIAPNTITTIMLNKPTGYVCSRIGQGNKTIYELLPAEFYNLKPVGRLDKDSSGLLLLTNDGELAQKLTHPSFEKQKVYQVTLAKPLTTDHMKKIEAGVWLDDGKSALQLEGSKTQWTVTMSEGRNRQIRRTFEKFGYPVIQLHRTQFGVYDLQNLTSGQFTEV